MKNVNMTKEFCRETLEKYGWELEYIPKNLITEELCMEAVNENGWALKYVPNELKEKIK